jgi:DNA-binding transcriptional ArsR family regulator
VARGLERYRRILSVYRDTSREAWASVSELLPAVDARIVSVIEAQRGATCDEVEQVTGFAHQTVSAQIRHMYEAGLLTETGERRPTRSGRAALVWASTTQGEMA